MTTDGMVVVSEDEFFRRLYADPRDIMPSVRNPEFTIWETKDRWVWGRSYPGWKNPGAEKVYMVKEAA
jgi:hypothetical protein